MTDEERWELLRIVGLRSVPQSVALRARIVLGAADGIGNKVLARQLPTSLPTVLLWRGRFQGEGLPGILQDRHRSGRPKEITPEQEAALLEKTLHSIPKNANSQVTVHHGSIAAREHRDLEAKFPDAGAHAIDCGVVLARVAHRKQNDQWATIQ
jgi:transposase